MKQFILILVITTTAVTAGAQGSRKLVYEGNGLYKKADYTGAEKKYQQALKKSSNSREARFNLGNVQFRQGQYDEALKTYEATTGNTNEEQAQVLYNKGVTLAKQDKLKEAMEAFRESLKKNPADADCRYNLALLMQKLKKQEEEQQKNQKNKNPKQQEQKKEQEPQRPKPQPSRLNKQQVQQVLQMIRRKEKAVQQKVNQQQTPGIVQKDKDW